MIPGQTINIGVVAVGQRNGTVPITSVYFEFSNAIQFGSNKNTQLMINNTFQVDRSYIHYIMSIIPISRLFSQHPSVALYSALLLCIFGHMFAQVSRIFYSEIHEYFDACANSGYHSA